MSDYEKLVEVFTITEYRDGAVFKTKSDGKLVWVDIEEKAPIGSMYVPPSTSYEGVSFRRKKKEG